MSIGAHNHVYFEFSTRPGGGNPPRHVEFDISDAARWVLSTSPTSLHRMNAYRHLHPPRVFSLVPVGTGPLLSPPSIARNREVGLFTNSFVCVILYNK